MVLGIARLVRAAAGGAVLSLVLLLASASAAAAQSLLGRPPNMNGTWTPPSGTVQFNFMHRFAATDAPTHKVLNSPTFLLGAGLPGRTVLGAVYATNSVLVPGFPNEWEFFGRYNPLAEAAGSPLELSLHGGYNQAARSWDGELAVARQFGALRLLASGRGFSAFRRDDARFAVAGGATVRLGQYVALAGDVATLLDRDDDEQVAWGAGLHLHIPYSPHTLSLHASNTHTTTLQGASIGTIDSRRWGFEFTIPVTLSRYFGARRGADVAPVEAPAAEQVVEVRMTELTFAPAAIRIRAGQTVRWRNTSVLAHTVTADPRLAQDPRNVQLPEGAAPFNSGDLNPGAVFSHTFTVPGEYVYFCIPHEAARMVGRVIVE